MQEQQKLSISENEDGHTGLGTQNWPPDLKIQLCVFCLSHLVSQDPRLEESLGLVIPVFCL